MNDIFGKIKKERIYQDGKWGEQNHIPVIWISILGEEFGEASKEALEFHFEIDDLERKMKLFQYRKELIQVAAVAIAAIESLERNELKT